MPKHEDIARDLTAKVIDLMESGEAGAWMKPWTTGSTGPVNASTKRAYTGGNWLVLSLVAFERGYGHGFWATYKQWESLGAQVRRGEKGTGAIRMGVSYRCQEGCSWRSSRSGERCPKHNVARRSVFPLGFTLFHGSQVDGWEAPEVADTFHHEDTLEDVGAWFDAIGADRLVGENAFYTPSLDAITMPAIERFEDPERYYSTLAHEHIHWTGHKDRLDRGLDTPTVFGTEKYAREELVAELGSVFVMAHLGLEAAPRGDHAAYLGSWLKTLKQDPSFLWSAASAAEKASSWLIEAAEGQEDTEAPEAQEGAA